MESYNIIVLIFGLITLFLLVLVYFINNILQYKIKIDNNFLVIRKIIDERIDIIDNMILFLKDNLEHEISYLKKIEQSKTILLNIKNNKEGINSIKEQENLFFNFINLENTYKKITKNENYLSIKENILNNRDKLVYAFDSYDKGVISYNNYKKNKLIMFLSKICKISEFDCYNK